MFQTKIVEDTKTNNLYSVACFFKLCSYEMWKNSAEWERPQMTIWRVRTACWISKDTNTHTLTICNTHCFIAEIVVNNAPQCYVNTVDYLTCYKCRKMRE